MSKAPKKLTLTVFSEFRASHSLDGFEIPHLHLWKLALEFQAALPLQSDRLIDLVLLQKQVDEITRGLSGTHLNHSLPEFQPTSENLAQWLYQKFSALHPDEPLTAVTVTLCDLSGFATGSARVET